MKKKPKRLKKDLIITSEALRKLERSVSWDLEDKSKRIPPKIWDTDKDSQEKKQKREKGKNLKEWEE